MIQVLHTSPETAGEQTIPRQHDSPPELSGLQSLVSHAYCMISGMLDRLRESQSLLQDTAIQKLQDTSAKLHEVTSATESAATDIMDGLDRTLALIDRLETGETAPGAVTSDLRDEIFGVMNHLQFQDITAQQLQHAASLLLEMETQMEAFKQLFDPSSHGLRITGSSVPQGRELTWAGPVTFDPAATTLNAEQRQALVDTLLAR